MKTWFLTLILALADLDVTAEVVGEDAIDTWQTTSNVIVSEPVRAELVNELSDVTARLRQSQDLQGKITDAALERAVIQYLNYNLRGTESPTLFYLAVEEISPGGFAHAYPIEYPLLTVSTGFEMTGIVINKQVVEFEPTTSKRLLMKIGKNIVATRGGEVDNCEYSIVAERGQHYIKECPEAD